MKKIDTLAELEELINEGKQIKVIYDNVYFESSEDPYMTKYKEDVTYDLSSLKEDSVICDGKYEIYRLNKTDILLQEISSDYIIIYRIIK